MQLYVAVTWGSQTRDSGEECDDGNMLAGDGCSDACQIEIACTWTLGTPDTWSWGCGNGLRKSTEQCDDGNLVNGDGWTATCTVETGFQCLGGSTTTIDVWSDACSDGKVYKRTANLWDDGIKIYTKFDPWLKMIISKNFSQRNEDKYKFYMK